MEFSGRLLVQPKDDRAANLLTVLKAEPIEGLGQYLITIPTGHDENSLGSQLAETGFFEFVQPDWILYPIGSVTPNDPSFTSQWHLEKIEAPRAWTVTTGDPTFTIAVVDTGADLTHPDLAPILVPGYCSHLTQRRSQANGGTVTDANGHGTAVIGVAAAAGNNATGVTGVGWNLRVMPIRATNPTTSSGGASFSDLQNGALWASNNGAKIINISYAGVAEPGVESLGATLRGRGCMLVWPMDDNSVNYATSFDHPSVTVVSGSDNEDTVYAQSSFGAAVDLAAPAVSIITTARGGGLATVTGNSFAGPMVCGAAAVLWGLKPSLTPAQVEELLIDGVDDIGPVGDDDVFGRGRLNLRWSLWLTMARSYLERGSPVKGGIRGVGLDDLYELSVVPRDVNNDGIIDDADMADALRFIRRGELKSLTGGS
jgi:thermitase